MTHEGAHCCPDYKTEDDNVFTDQGSGVSAFLMKSGNSPQSFETH